MKIYSLEEIKKLSENGNFNKENNCRSQNKCLKNKCENNNDKINYEDDNAQMNYENDNAQMNYENDNVQINHENNFGYSLAEFDNAKTKILKYVLYKKRSENEIIKKFENEFDSDLIQAVVSDLKEKDYVNDANYIKRSVNEFMALRNLSLFEIKYKLMSKGIKTSDIEDYFSQNYEVLMEYEKSSAKKIAQKKFSKMEEIDIKKYLMKKGYKSDSIKAALNEY
jgi:SOS response regulatory protein OraA/RecX